MTNRSEDILGQIRGLMEDSEISEEEAVHVSESILPKDIGLFRPAAILALVKDKLGDDTAREFESLVVYGVVPADPSSLLEFLKTRKDLVSVMCLNKLGEHQDV